MTRDRGTWDSPWCRDRGTWDSPWCRDRGTWDSPWCRDRGTWDSPWWCRDRGTWDSPWCRDRGTWDSPWCRIRGTWDSPWCRVRGNKHRSQCLALWYQVSQEGQCRQACWIGFADPLARCARSALCSQSPWTVWFRPAAAHARRSEFAFLMSAPKTRALRKCATCSQKTWMSWSSTLTTSMCETVWRMHVMSTFFFS
jgi:hypothetical protein